MAFEHTFPEWAPNGVKSAPSESLQETGFVGGMKPPASVFNYQWNKTGKAITELQGKSDAHDAALAEHDTKISEMESAVGDVASGLIPIVHGTSEDGVTYTATVEGLDLIAGRLILFIPDKTTTTVTPQLNVNGTGAINIRRKLSSGTATLTQGSLTTFLYKNRPTMLMYDTGVTSLNAWIALEFTRPEANDLYGKLSVQNGGTYANSSTTDDDKASARESLGITPENIGAAPAYTSGTTDLTAGSSALETGKLHFVYE